jgi:hypothetical protein
MRRTLLTLFLISCICAGISAVSAETLSISDAAVAKGETATILLLLDEVPDGLSGYNLTVSLTNTAAADITGVEFPDWAALHENSPLPDDSVQLQAIDLNEEVDAGATNVELAQITVTGVAPGQSGITVSVELMDNDAAEPMAPEIVEGTLVVEGEPGEPTVTPTTGPGGATTAPTTGAQTPSPTTMPTGEPTDGVTTLPTGTSATPTPEPTSQPGFGFPLALAAAGMILLLRKER